jgi:SAM-dependent methyltransferase
MLNTQEPPLAQEPDDEYQFYTRYYAAVATSHANAAYCQRLYGLNLCQHGFAEVAHLNQMLEFCSLNLQNRVLDLGCGNGLIAEYISDRSGAHITGIDFIPDAIRQTQDRTRNKRDRLDFTPHSFDTVLFIDTLYFTGIESAIQQILRLLKPGGGMCAFYSHSLEPGHPEESFSKDSLPAEKTPLGIALVRNNLSFQAWDFSRADYEHALRKYAIADELKIEFETEGNLFLYENHIAEAKGVAAAFEKGCHARYLYYAKTSQ